MEEVWKTITGFEDFYEVSNLGKVRSKTRYVKNGRGQRICRGKFLSARNNGTGYFFVTLYDAASGKQVSKYIHNLVAEAFLGEKPRGISVDHLDSDKSNNALENLEYVTFSENSRRWRGDIIGWDTTKMNQEQVRWVRYHRALYGNPYKHYAEALGVSTRAIQKAVNRETWRNVV